MSQNPKSTRCICVVVACISYVSTACWVFADDSTLKMEASRAMIAERIQTSPEISDAAYDVYVSANAIAQACDDVDSAALTDIALQLAEGERILLRPRNAITSRQAFQLALNAASLKNDVASLERLAQFAAQQNDKDLEGQIVAVQKLPAVSRATTPEIPIPIDSVEPAQADMIRHCILQIDRAKLTADSRSLQAMDVDLDLISHEPLRYNLRQLIADARATLPESSGRNEQLISALFRMRMDDDDPEDDVESGQQGSDATGMLLAVSRSSPCTKCSGTGRYVRGFQIVKCDRCDGSGQTHDKPIGTKQRVDYKYSIVNTTNQLVRFRLPSGRDYSLAPNASESYRYVSEGYYDQDKATMHVRNSDREYKLAPGRHRFIPLAGGRVGFQLNY